MEPFVDSPILGAMARYDHISRFTTLETHFEIDRLFAIDEAARLEREFGPELHPRPGYYRSAYCCLQKLTSFVERPGNNAQWDPESPVVAIKIAGDESVGKTALLTRFIENRFGCTSYLFYPKERTTFTFETSPKRFPALKMCKAKFWDTRGYMATRFRCSAKVHWQFSHAIILAFDLTRAESFESLKTRWIIGVLQFAPVDCKFVVVGLKSDLCPTKRQVSAEDAQRFAAELCCPYVEASSKTGKNIDETVLYIVGKALETCLGRTRQHSQPPPPPSSWVPNPLEYVGPMLTRIAYWAASWIPRQELK